MFLNNWYYLLIDISNSGSWKVKIFTVTMLLGKPFFVSIVYHRITFNYTVPDGQEDWLLVSFCWFFLHFCLEDYRIVLNLCYFCHSLKIGTYGQRCEDFQKIINVCFRRVVAGDVYVTKFDDKFSWLVCTANSLRIRSIESITKAPYFSLHIIVTVNFVFRANYCFEKFNFFFKCDNYYFTNESLIFFFVVHILLQFNN